jgi:hypothetical protein
MHPRDRTRPRRRPANLQHPNPLQQRLLPTQGTAKSLPNSQHSRPLDIVCRVGPSFPVGPRRLTLGIDFRRQLVTTGGMLLFLRGTRETTGSPEMLETHGMLANLHTHATPVTSVNQEMLETRGTSITVIVVSLLATGMVGTTGPQTARAWRGQEITLCLTDVQERLARGTCPAARKGTGQHVQSHPRAGTNLQRPQNGSVIPAKGPLMVRVATTYGLLENIRLPRPRRTLHQVARPPNPRSTLNV